MNRLAPSAGPLAFISPVIEFAEPGDKLRTFVDQVRVVGILLRKGRFDSDSEMVKRELWSIARANGLTGEPDSFEEEITGWEIDKATAIDDEPRANGPNGREPPPHTKIPESADADRAPIKNTTMTATLPKKPYKLVLARDITAEGTLKVFLIDGFLGRDEVSFWFGEPEGGKSTAAIDAACHVATGRPWCGRAVMQGAVLYVAAERGQTVKRRIMAWRLEHEIDDFPLAVIDDSVDLRTGKVDADRILAAADELAKLSGQSVVWIIFDTLSRVLAGGDENSSRDMGILVLSIDRIHRKTKAHCSLIHHMPLVGDRMRGHSLANGAGDTTIKVDKKDGIVTASVAKASDLPEDEKPAMSFRFKSITVSEQPHRTASVMVQVEASAAARAATPRTKTRKEETKVIRTFRDAFAEALDDSGETIQVHGDGPKVRAVDIRKVRAEFARRYATGEDDPKKCAEASRKAFRRTIKELPMQFATETRDSRELIWKVE
jgi:hypothetical protein